MKEGRIMLDVKDLYEKDYIGEKITISGWIKNHRKQAHFGFIDLSDGTCFKSLQVVYDDKLKKFVDSEIKEYKNLYQNEKNRRDKSIIIDKKKYMLENNKYDD